MTDRIVRIGGASAYTWDSQLAIPQLLRAEALEYLVMDCLAEGTLAVLARTREVDESFPGFNTDVIDYKLAPHLRDILARGVKVIANAGGLDPRAFCEALSRTAARLGLNPKVAYVLGDDIMPIVGQLGLGAQSDMFNGASLPAQPASANVYLGAFPIAHALRMGADIVITGRSADSALALGALIHEFGWSPTDFDRLAAGTLIGHLLECGQQVTGGTFTDWREVPRWDDMGWPIAECRADGTCVLTKIEGTGGLVTPATVGEQMCYEISDPQAYHVADVACDFSQVRMEQEGPDRVRVSGVVGREPTPTYKASVTALEGWRGVSLLPIIGIDAAAKAERQADAFITRMRRMLREKNLADWRAVNVELLGAESAYGDKGRRRDAREVIARITVDHDERAAVDLFAREQGSLFCAMSPGATNFLPVTVTPVIRLQSALVDKSVVAVSVTCNGRTEPSAGAFAGRFDPGAIPRPPAPPSPDQTLDATLPLVALAWGRSGDKGDLFNVAVIARRPEYLPYISAHLTPGRIAEQYSHVFAPGSKRRVDRFEMPGILAINFVVHDSLDGGFSASRRLDSVAKGMAQQLLEMPIPVPSDLHHALQPTLARMGMGDAYEGA